MANNTKCTTLSVCPSTSDEGDGCHGSHCRSQRPPASSTSPGSHKTTSKSTVETSARILKNLILHPAKGRMRPPPTFSGGSYGKKFAIPAHEAIDALLHIGIGTIIHILHQILDIRKSGRHIVRLHRQPFLLDGLAQSALNGLNKVQQAHRVIIADIVDPVRR